MIRYVDLQISGGVHAGTELDPFTFDEWQTDLATVETGSTFYMKNSWGAESVDFGGLNDYHIYLPWEPKINGPWNVYCALGLTIKNCSLTGGRISSVEGQVTSDANSSCYSMFIISNTTESIKGTFKGCTFVINLSGTLSEAIFDDSVITCGETLNGGSSVLNNCAISAGTWTPASSIRTNCQEDWVAPAFPNFEGNISEFKYDTLYSTIETPPQPGLGFPAYTDYELDLCGAPRLGTGIGSGASLLTVLYVDLSSTTDGHAGTELDPFSFADLLAHTQILEETYRFYCKGTIDFIGSVDLSRLNETNYYAWEPYNNGPPRIRCSGDFTATMCTFYGFILSFNEYASSGMDAVRFFGCYIISDGDFYADTVRESIVNVSRILSGRYNNSLIKAGSGTTLDYINWCAANTTGWTVGNTDNSQIDWVYPTFPSWDAPKEDFNIDLFLIDVDTPPQSGNSLSYLDLWGMTKNNVGTGYFVPTFVDLSSTTDGHAGTELDPFSFTDWQTDLSTKTEKVTYLMKGSKDYTGVIDMAGTNDYHIYLPWDPSTNGPWRLHSTGILNKKSCTLTGGIIATDGELRDSGGSYPYNSMYIIANNTEEIYFSCPLNGCTLILSSGFLDGNTVKDTVFVCSGTLNGGPSILDNCAISAGSYTPASIERKCQTDWVAPSMPAWDADKSAFNYDNLYSTIETPPQSGTLPYLNYSFDLWGNVRTGIGSGDKASAIAPEWSATYPKVSTITYDSIKILAEIDQTGTVYYKVRAHGATAPTSAEIKASPTGSISVTADTESSFTATLLNQLTTYDIYVVAESESLILQDSPSLIEATTSVLPYKPAPSGSPDGNVGMPPKSNNTIGGGLDRDRKLGNGIFYDNPTIRSLILDVLPRDSKLGNLNGAINDNSAGENPVERLMERIFNTNVPGIPKWFGRR